jgi:hypothetical protein
LKIGPDSEKICHLQLVWSIKARQMSIRQPKLLCADNKGATFSPKSALPRTGFSGSVRNPALALQIRVHINWRIHAV